MAVRGSDPSLNLINTGLGQGKLEVRKQAGSFHLHSEMATQARNNRDHAVRRKVEALLKPHALLLFPSEFDDGNGGSGSGSDDSDEEDGAERGQTWTVPVSVHPISPIHVNKYTYLPTEKPTALIQVRAQKRETRKEAPVRPKLAKGWDRKRVEAEAAKRISALVDLAAQLEFHKTRQKRLEVRQSASSFVYSMRGHARSLSRMGADLRLIYTHKPNRRSSRHSGSRCGCWAPASRRPWWAWAP